MNSATPHRADGATDLLQSAIDAVRGLPTRTQDEIAQAMLDWAHHFDAETDVDEDLLASLAEAERGEFASEDEVRAMWAKFGL